MVIGSSLPVDSLKALISGTSAVSTYWCSMARTGSSRPTIRPTSRAHRPPALTTCSAWIGSPPSIWTSHVSSGRCDSPVTSVCRRTSAPAIWAHFTYAWVTPVGSTWPSTRSYSAPTKYCGSITGKMSRASEGVIISSSIPR